MKRKETTNESLHIVIDSNGRIVPHVKGLINYKFRSIDNCITCNNNNKKDILRDLFNIFNARKLSSQDKYSSGETYFIKRNQTPRCNLENLALNIFRFHATNLDYDPDKSGAEWWTLAIDSKESTVGFHWDKDYELEEYGINIFPNISTVTYFSNCGYPTLILNITAPSVTGTKIEDSATKAYCSQPSFGKHISFDGRFLHYASSDVKHLFNSYVKNNIITSEKDFKNLRYTFLVNLWFNHLPKLVRRIPKCFLKKLSMHNVIWNENTLDAKVSSLSFNKDETITYKYKLNSQHKIILPLPKKLKCHTNSLEINYFNSEVRPTIAHLNKKKNHI